MTTIQTAASAPSRILIVEDEAVIAMDMAQHLRDFGYEVCGIAASGDRARQMVAESHPDLIMMDVMIKGPRDGIETARQIRADVDIPVVFLTAYGDARTLERAKQVNPFGYLLKPFRPNDLRTTIEVALHKQSLERQVRENADWLDKTLQCLGDGVIASNPDGHIRFMNWIAERLTGTTLQAARGQPASQVFGLHDDTTGTDLPDLLLQAMQGGAPVAPRRALLHNQAGEPGLYVDAGASPIRDDHGGLLGGVLVFRDVRQQRLDEQELQRYRQHLEDLVAQRTQALEIARNEAERSSRARADFLAAISHEMRTPLNAVLGFTRLMALIPRPDREATYLRHVLEGGEHLLQLIDDLLDLAKIDAGRLSVLRQAVDVAQVLTQSLSMVEGLAASRAVSLTVEPPAGPLQVAGDATRLTQVLVNLLSNAVKYNRQGGRVQVVCSLPTPECVRISVADTGSGIAEADQRRLFQTFERLGAENRAVAGSGIGLAFSKRLVELMQGELAMHSELGVGSTFWIELQRWPTSDAPSPGPREAA